MLQTIVYTLMELAFQQIPFNTRYKHVTNYSLYSNGTQIILLLAAIIFKSVQSSFQIKSRQRDSVSNN